MYLWSILGVLLVYQLGSFHNMVGVLFGLFSLICLVASSHTHTQTQVSVVWLPSESSLCDSLRTKINPVGCSTRLLQSALKPLSLETPFADLLSSF